MLSESAGGERLTVHVALCLRGGLFVPEAGAAQGVDGGLRVGGVESLVLQLLNETLLREAHSGVEIALRLADRVLLGERQLGAFVLNFLGLGLLGVVVGVVLGLRLGAGLNLFNSVLDLRV